MKLKSSTVNLSLFLVDSSSKGFDVVWPFIPILVSSVASSFPGLIANPSNGGNLSGDDACERGASTIAVYMAFQHETQKVSLDIRALLANGGSGCELPKKKKICNEDGSFSTYLCLCFYFDGQPAYAGTSLDGK